MERWLNPGQREKEKIWRCGKLGGELTIGHTRGEVLPLVVLMPADIPGALSRRLRWLTFQHVDYVHPVDALQSCVQTLHCREDAGRRHKTKQQRAESFTAQPDTRGLEKFPLISDVILTLGPLAFACGPQVEQRRALLQQRVGILHTDLIDIIHAQLKLTCQFCKHKPGKPMQTRGVFI